MNTSIPRGTMNGGEIEPGTFHGGFSVDSPVNPTNPQESASDDGADQSGDPPVTEKPTRPSTK